VGVTRALGGPLDGWRWLRGYSIGGRMPIGKLRRLSGRWQCWHTSSVSMVSAQHLGDARLEAARECAHPGVSRIEQRLDILRGRVARNGNTNLKRPRLPIHGKRYRLPQPDMSGIIRIHKISTASSIAPPARPDRTLW
jgi:hypothetical protein